MIFQSIWAAFLLLNKLTPDEHKNVTDLRKGLLGKKNLDDFMKFTTTSKPEEETHSKEHSRETSKETIDEQENLLPSLNFYRERMTDVKKIVLKQLRNGVWKKEKAISGGAIYSLTNSDKDTVYLANVTLDASVDAMMDFLWEKVEDAPTWNKQIENVTVLMNIDSDTRITYQKTPSLGIVKPRYFINLSRKDKIDDSYYIFYETVDYPLLTIEKGLAKGKNGPSAMVLSPIFGEPTKSTFSWQLNVDFRSQLINLRVMKVVFPTIMEDLVKAFINQAKKLRSAAE